MEICNLMKGLTDNTIVNVYCVIIVLIKNRHSSHATNILTLLLIASR